MNLFDQAVLETALTKLFSGRYFDICQVDKIGELLGVNPGQHPNYTRLRALHCVDYRDMPNAVLEQLQQKVVECLQPRPHMHSGAMLAKALLLEGNDHVNTEDTYIKQLN